MMSETRDAGERELKQNASEYVIFVCYERDVLRKSIRLARRRLMDIMDEDTRCAVGGTRTAIGAKLEELDVILQRALELAQGKLVVPLQHVAQPKVGIGLGGLARIDTLALHGSAAATERKQQCQES
mgnify:CR=1 FL=1